MKAILLICAAGLAAFAYRMRSTQSAVVTAYNPLGVGLLGTHDDVLSGVGDAWGGLSAAVQGAVAGFGLKLSAMKAVTAQDLANSNVRAFLRVIRTGEGTAGIDGYRKLFGGGLFDSFVWHPNIKVTAKAGKGSLTSTAAGAYQALYSTWMETAALMGLRDFSAASQDKFAVGRIAARGALDDVKAGRFEVAVAKCAREWASLPGSPYGQPVITMARAQYVYKGAGGTTA